MKVYAVVYGNYSPSEVDALYLRREDAEADAAARNAEPGSSRMWEVEEWTVRERYAPPAAQPTCSLCRKPIAESVPQAKGADLGPYDRRREYLCASCGANALRAPPKDER